jgi:cation:H+ antiporter
MASVTSLPELITGISAVAIFGVPNIAAGDVLGSCMSILLIIVLLDALSGASPISSKAHQGQVITAAFGVLLLRLCQREGSSHGSLWERTVEQGSRKC